MHTATTPTAQRSRTLHVRSLHEATRSVDIIASTAAIDSYGEIVEQSWRLDRYLRNPVVLFGHNSRSLPIGKASNVRVEGGALRATITFAEADANPEAERVWQLVRGGFLSAVSVGFVPGTVRKEVRNGQEIYVLADNELHEISVVPIPANPEAVMRMRAAGITPMGVPPGVALAALAMSACGDGDDARRLLASDAGIDLDAPAAEPADADTALAVMALRHGDVHSANADAATELAALAMRGT